MQISPAHALILIIADRKSKTHTPEQLEKLSKLLLVGVQNDADQEYFQSLLQDPVLSGHNVSTTPTVIDNCKVRRFFETLLCYETLKDSIYTLDAVQLEKFYNNLMHMHAKYYHTKLASTYGKTLKEYYDDKPKEYLDSHFRIDNEPCLVDHFDEAQRKKLHQIVESCIRCVLCTQKPGLRDGLPTFRSVFENNTFFSESRRMQRKLVQEKRTLPSKNFGVIFSITNIENIDTPIASCKYEYTYIKSSEKATYVATHEWARFVFPMLMHPFSNGASGTVLGQLKLLYHFGNHKANKSASAKKSDHQFVKNYLKNLICLMLFLSGGHSLYEYVYPLAIPAVRDSLKAFMGEEEITFEDLFLHSNDAAFARTLSKTIEYSNQVIAKGANTFDLMYEDHISDASTCSKIDQLCKAQPSLVTERITSLQWTPLQFAVAKKMPYTLRALVKYELQEKHPHRDKDLKHALALAKEQGDNYSIALLFLATLGVESLSKINTKLDNGKTPYQMAVAGGSMRVITSLKRLGAKPA